MAERFLKLNLDSDESDFLAIHHPNAFILLYFVAKRARRILGLADGLSIGECHIGDYKSYGLTEREYRTAKAILVQRKIIEIIETCRNRKKSTTGTTTVGTLVKLLDSKVWDINPETTDDRNDDRPTTDRRRTRKNKKEKEEDHHPNPSSAGSDSDPELMTDDDPFLAKLEKLEKIEIHPRIFLTPEELEECIRIKGSIESVKEAIDFIQKSPKRSAEILSWPRALSTWKIPIKKISIEENLSFAEKLCKGFERYRGWECRIYHDRQKDQKGVLFSNESPYKEPIFIALADGEFRKKCEQTAKKIKN